MKRPPFFSLCVLALTILIASPGASGETATPILRKPAGVVYDKAGRLLISDTGNNRLLVFQGEKLVAEVGKEGGAPGEFREPRGITLDSQERVILCDSGNGRIQILDRELKPVALFGKPSSDDDRSPGTFASPSGVTTDDRDNIIVADTYNHRLQIFDRDGKFLALFDNAGKENTDLEGFNEPGGVFFDGKGALYVANGWNSRCDVYDYDSAEPSLKHRGKERGQIWGFWVCCDVAVNSVGEIVALNTNDGAVCIYPPDFEKDNRTPSRRFTGGPFGPLREPRALAVGPGDEVAVCDTNNNRVLILNKEFVFPARPEVLSMSPVGLTISWKTLVPTRSTLLFREGNAPGEGEGVENIWLLKDRGRLIAEGAAAKNYHVVSITSLKPTSRYWYKVHMPTLKQIPLSGFSQEYAAATAAAPGTKQFIRLPVAVIIFPNVINLDTLRPDSPLPPPADRERLRYYTDECDKASRFYWVNTRMNLFLENAYVLDETWYYVGDKSFEEYEIPSDWKEHIKSRPPHYTGALAAKKLGASAYAGVLVITAQRRWDEPRKQWVYEESGGGTYGIRYPVRPGESFILGGSDIAWLYTHEVGHQIDSFFAESGYDGTYRDWMFNHLAPAMNTAYKHGEHYDGNAWLARAVPSQRFFQLKYGDVRTSPDGDGDGIPDNDKRVPLDEVRFRSNPNIRDTDYDGLGDMEEVLASNWVFEMLPAVSNVRSDYRLPDPTDPDTDDDGIPDGFDPYPLYAVRTTVPRAVQPPLLDGRIESGLWVELYTFTAGEFRATLFAAWDESNLYLACRFYQEIPRVSFQLDMDDDGWYVGKDNYEVSVSRDGGGWSLVDAWVNNCAEKKTWPFRDDNLSRDMGIELASGIHDALHEIELSVPRRPEVGLDLHAAEIVGFTFNCLLQEGTDRWVSAFEPYHFVTITLAENE